MDFSTNVRHELKVTTTRSETSCSFQSPKKWSKIVSIPLKSKLHHLAFRPNNGARDNILAVATEAELAVFKVCSEVFCLAIELEIRTKLFLFS